MRIALLEDDQDQARMVGHWLEGAGHTCVHFDSGKGLIRSMRIDSFDILILDWLVPDITGLEVLEWTRARFDWNIPVLFLTRLDTEEDVVKALEAGADDYISKPARQHELLARLKTLGRRASLGQSTSRILEFAPYKIDIAGRAIQFDGDWIDLTQKEYELTLFMFQNAGRALSRGHILDNVWGTSPDLNTRTVDTHVSRLRKKLHINKENGWSLSSIYQHGYRLEQVHTT